MRAQTRCAREQVGACMGYQREKHRGHPPPREQAVRGGQKWPGGSSQKSARLAVVTRRGANDALACDFPRGGDHKVAKGPSLLPGAGGRGAVLVILLKRAGKVANDQQCTYCCQHGDPAHGSGRMRRGQGATTMGASNEPSG